MHSNEVHWQTTLDEEVCARRLTAPISLLKVVQTSPGPVAQELERFD